MQPVELVEQCLAAIDQWESTVRAWVFVDRDYALAEARRLSDELKRGECRGPLHGMPIGVKDIIDVKNWPTAAGSKQWAQSYARQDADVIRRLRQAGAIFLGKTVTTQYASFDPSVTRNPWNLERTPGGSSSGSAVAVACGMCVAALGTQTGGSIIRPASYCGIAAMKPSFDYCSSEGIVPLAHSMDHPGPMARSVKDLALVLDGMSRFDGSRRFHALDETVDPAERRPLRFARPRGFSEGFAEPRVTAIIDSVCETLCARKAVVDDVPLPSGFSEVLSRHRKVMAVEAAQFHRERFARYPQEYEPCISELLREGLACSGPDYADCLEHRDALKRDMREVLDWEAIAIMPATTSPAPPMATTGDPALNSPWSYLGLPTVSIPTGKFIDGLPISVQLIGHSFFEDHLLRAAMWVEETLGVGPLTPPFPPRT